MSAIKTQQVTKRYGYGPTAVYALRGVDLVVGKGEFVAIMGPSGSGKSTLLAILGGLDRPDTGAVWIDGSPIVNRAEHELAQIRRTKIGFIFQSFNLIPVLTAEENVSVPLLLDGQKGPAVQKRAKGLLSLVGLADKLDRTPLELSGGQQQRVAIARALMAQPALILADEPTGNLDTRAGAEIMGLLQRLCEELGHTVVLVTHDPAMAAWTDRAIFLRDGAIVADTPLVGSLPEKAALVRAQMERVTDYA